MNAGIISRKGAKNTTFCSVELRKLCVLAPLREINFVIDSLADQLFHDRAVDVGEAEVSAGVAVGEFLVVEAQELQ
jgi:hypothetical protein